MGKDSGVDLIQERVKYLRENMDFVSTLFDSLIDYAIIASDFDGNIIAYNEGAKQIYSYAPEEIIGKENIEIFFPREFIEAGRLQQLISDLIVKEQVSYKGEKVRKDGSRFPAQILLTITKDKNSKVVGFIEIVQDLTEQKRAKEVLCDVEERFSKAFRANPDAMTISRMSDGMLFEVNDMWEKTLGYSRAESVGISSVTLGIWSDPAMRQKAVKQLQETGSLRNFETDIRRKTGEVRQVSLSSERLDIGGEQCLLTIIQDITERKHAEEALRQSEERFRLASESSNDLIYEWDLKDRIDWFGKINKLLGYAPDELPGTFEAWANSVHPDDRGRVEAAIKNHLEKNESYNIEYRVKKKDGTYNYWWARGTAIRDEKGNPSRWLGAVTDITERRLVEDALRESEKRYRQVVENATEIIYSLDTNGNFTYSNPAGLRACGFSLEELRQYNYLDLILPEHQKRLKETYIKQFYERQPTTYVEFPFSSKSGKVVWFGQNAFLVIEEGKVVGFHVIARDITERKQAEEALRRVEENFRRSLDDSPLGVRIVTTEGETIYANRAILGIYGYDSIEELRTTPVKKRYTPESYAEFNIRKEKRQRDEYYPSEYEISILRKNGEIRHLQVFHKEVLWNGRKQFQTIYQDITERKWAEQALFDSEQRYRNLVENAPDAIFTLAPDGTITSLNPAFETITGWSQSEWLHKQFPPILHPDDLSRGLEFFQRIMKGEEIAAFELRVLRKPSDYMVAEFTVTPQTQNGSVIGVLGIARDITERNRVEEALQESENRFRQIVENTEEWIWEVDPEGLYTYASPIVEKILGYKPEEVVEKMHFYDLFPPEVKEEFKKAALGAFARRESFKKFVNPNIHKLGHRVILETSGVPILNAKGDLLGYRGADIDITERKHTEEALRQSEKRFRELYDNAPVGYFEYDSQGRIASVNRTELEMLGYTFEEMIGQPVWKFIVEKEEARQQILAKLAGTIPPARGFERTYRRKDGTTFPAIVEDRLILDLEGKIKGIRATIQNITERKRTEEALRASEKRFRELFDEAPVGYHEIDKEGKITRVNRKELDMLGYTAEEMLGQYVSEFITEEISPQAVKRKLAGTLPIAATIERTYLRKDGTTIPALLEETLIKDSGGRIIGIRTTIQDITEHKRAEREMATLQDQLRQSQKMEAIGQLAGGIAHDFNNLLTVIKGYSQLSLTEMKEEDPLRENVEEIKKSAERAADLTHQLLAFSRRQIMEMKVLDLNDLLRNLDKMLRRVIGEDIELANLLAEDLGRVKVDPGQIEQIIMNLAVNARDAMPKGGKLTIETANVELDEEYARNHVAVKTGGYVMLAVSDTGVGMTPEVRDRVFEPFFTAKEEGKGTGLGLSTVYGIVKQSGGTIWVYSELGKGTTFKIYFPRVDEPLDEISEKVTVRKGLLRGSETILVVEDEEEVRRLTVRILKELGYRVLEAGQGIDTFPVADEHKGPIHLLLTDVVMPKMSGRELAERLKPLYPMMEVLYMSGYTDNTIIHHGVLEKGMNYIQKPFTVDGLARKVREVLDK
jgi:two-component system cell cycle sensor histidine kinase/response regulator CckA